MLRAHGMICNGGVFHVFDTLTEAQIETAKAGYCFFGLGPVARLISRANLLLTGTAEELGDLEAALYAEYASYIPDDSELTSRFERHYAAKPADFAPLV
ncbi:MAG: hypothetical protein NT031_06805 [Planctomycetota bacterium]|nr:hypothetical protein [Planctomycetota bacterium]